MTRADGAGAWIAMHIFYAADARPVLTECLRPLVRDLREQGLLERFFFINYWLEGQHVRFRVKPKYPELEQGVREKMENAVSAYLKRRPALYDYDSEFLLSMYEDMFRLEYSEQERIERYGQDGPMPLRENNTFAFLPYEPEYAKYGGRKGIELAEWHFERSSDLVLDILSRANTHLRTALLGLCSQLMMVMGTTFLPDRKDLGSFLSDYHEYWQHAFQIAGLATVEKYEENFTQMSERLSQRFSDIEAGVHGADGGNLSSFVRDWSEHCAELRARVVDLSTKGDLLFPSWDPERMRLSGKVGEFEPVTDPDAALRVLLSPYMHMTNNRLGATIVDEAYLAYLLARVTGGRSARPTEPAS